jgi:regulator of protease activity HflC (stomatin/prohibitin superfamily)
MPTNSASLGKGSIIGLIGLGLGGLFTISILGGSFFTVGQNERAVVTRNGAFSHIAEPGFHFKMPFIDGVTDFHIDNQQFTTGKLNSYTIDNQEVDATLTVQYKLPADAVEYTFTNNRNFEDKLQSMVIDRWKTAAGKVNVTDIANNRGKVVKDVGDIVKAEAQRLYHLEVIDVQLPELEYQPSFRQAQAQAAVVKTQIEQAQGLKQKAEIEAQTAQITASGEANKVIEQARGQAESTRLQAIAEAKSIEIKGQSQAAAQELMAQALTRNPSLVALAYAQRWDGKLPVNLLGTAPIPLLETNRFLSNSTSGQILDHPH